MTEHREINSSCPVTWEDEPRGFLTEWEATSMKPTEDAKMGNDDAGRPMPEAFKDPHHLANTADAMGRLCKSWQGSTAEYHFACRDTLRTQAARIAELEGDALRMMKGRDEFVAKLNTHIAALGADAKAARDAAAGSFARAEAAEAALAEMTRRRDEWRKKAEGYDAVRLALREKIGSPWPPHMSRLLWAGIAADEKKRADDAEAEVARLREAIEADCRQWFYYPIEMPVTADGEGPATVGVDAVQITYEVWDRLLSTHASFDNLPDAINEAIRLNAAAAKEAGE